VATRDVTSRVNNGPNGRRAKAAPLAPSAHQVAGAAVDVPEEVLVSAAKQLTLRCGESSITLTAAGKIIIRGKYIVSRSSGVHRIKGGSVQIN
jgi:hypothetical protein